jgi:two-component system chemotaxis response regulator CheB
MPGHDIVVVGASAGGVEALMTLARSLPADLPAALCVVLHISPTSPSLLPQILDRAGPLKAVAGVDHTPIRPGHIYVAPPDHHLLVEDRRVRIVRGPSESRHRPALDPLFRSAAVAYGPRVIGVVLTGALDDGTAGLEAIKQRGGIAIVQDPNEAFYPGMPQSALDNVAVDHCLPLAEIGPVLARLARQPAPDAVAYPVPREMELETRVAMLNNPSHAGDEPIGTSSGLSCPECNGVLFEIPDGELMRFRCRVGHAFSPQSVLAEQSEALETALWVALKTLEESASLSRRLAAQARGRNHSTIAARFEERIAESEQRAGIIRNVLQQGLLPVAAGTD